MNNESNETYRDLLEAFGKAWNRHDVEAIVSMMTPDCQFVMAGGKHPWGDKLEGTDAVRQGIQAILSGIPDARWTPTADPVVSGDRGLTEWRLTGTQRDGSELSVDGVDVFTFREGKIHVKNAFRKALSR